MNSIDCEILSINVERQLLPNILAAQEAVARLDERAKRVTVRDGWRERLLFDEACACLLSDGDLVHVEDLVLLDGHVRMGAASIALSQALHVLQAWRSGLDEDAAVLLVAGRPGLRDRVAQQSDGADASTGRRRYAADPPTELMAIDAARLERFHQLVKETAAMPAVVAAAVIWDAWLVLSPEPGSAWRAPLLASLVLRSRGLTGEFLLPIDTGRRFAPYRREPGQNSDERLAGFLSWIEAATRIAGKELNALVLAGTLLRQRIKGRRRGSRLPALVNLLLSRPLVTVPIAATALACSHQAIEQMLPLLGSIPREVTGRKRFRAWAVP